MALKSLGLQRMNLDFGQRVIDTYNLNNADIKTRGLEVHVLSGGLAYDCTGVTLRLYVRTKSLNVYESVSVTVGGVTGVFEVLFPEGISSGMATGEIILSNTTETIGSFQFSVNVINSLTSDATISQAPGAGILLDVIQNEPLRVIAESARADAEIERVIAFDTMIANGYILPKSPVATFADLATTYPNPVTGWTSKTLDDGKLYRWDGTGWIWIDTVTTSAYDSIVNGIEHIKLQLEDIAINVKTFVCDDGQFVKGDGIHDDTTGIRAAIEYCKSIYTGDGETSNVSIVKQLFFPTGRYLVTSTIMIPTFMKIAGAGKNSTIFISGITNGTPLLQLNGSGWSTANFYNTLSSFSMHGSNANAIGIKINFANRFKLEDIYIDNFLNNGVSVWNSDIGKLDCVCIRGCGNTDEAGLKIDGTDINYSSHAIAICACEIAGCYGDGLYSHYGSVLSISDSTVIQGNAKAGIHSDSTATLAINGSYFENNLNHVEMISCLGASVCSSVFGPIHAGGKADILVNNPSALAISGNLFARALSEGQYIIGALGTPDRMWTVAIENNTATTLPISIEPSLLELIKVGGGYFSSPVENVPTIYSRTDYYDGLKTTQGNVDIVNGDLRFGNRARIKTGAGYPNVYAESGSLYLRTDGDMSASIFYNIDGSSGGWVPMQPILGYYTASRPTVSRGGFMIFDVTLGKPIWWRDDTWVDATGTPV